MAYYKGLFKIHHVRILARERFITYGGYSPKFFYKYLIQLDNGKIKYVHEDKLIIPEDREN